MYAPLAVYHSNYMAIPSTLFPLRMAFGGYISRKCHYVSWQFYGVTIDAVWIGNRVYCTLIQTTRNNKLLIHTLCSSLQHVLRFLSLCLHQSLSAGGSQQCPLLPWSRSYRLNTVPQLTYSSPVNCCWPSPVELFLVLGPVGTYYHTRVFILSRLLRVLKWGLSLTRGGVWLLLITPSLLRSGSAVSHLLTHWFLNNLSKLTHCSNCPAYNISAWTPLLRSYLLECPRDGYLAIA
jgi:hypothetical protein